jgi:hypothetical protein
MASTNSKSLGGLARKSGNRSVLMCFKQPAAFYNEDYHCFLDFIDEHSYLKELTCFTNTFSRYPALRTAHFTINASNSIENTGFFIVQIGYDFYNSIRIPFFSRVFHTLFFVPGLSWGRKIGHHPISKFIYKCNTTFSHELCIANGNLLYIHQ